MAVGLAAMLTDRLPAEESLRTEYMKSDGLLAIELPQDGRLRGATTGIEAAMNSGEARALRKTCAEFLFAAADFYGVAKPQIRVLVARPLRVREGGWATELFGDYHPDERLIRVWMRTAVRKQVTSFGTFLSTLCHEFCHHLDSRICTPLLYGLDSEEQQRSFDSTCRKLHRFLSQSPS